MWGYAVAEISKIFSSFFSYEQTATERQSETYTIKGSKKSEKAINIAEKIIFLADEEIKQHSTEKVQKKYQKLRKQFFKFNN